ncbi:hypothetical protein [Parasporobacterium paucivorans]|uniref:Uncharacterized protein n=1 Tax=Parasporobacterium paucivorans DSM 15970 TaxID=1122934 RepID=A0A1M6G1R9_9FIRM|nr:hypothetical protein [Parasporobacterium paucivorans]SHJ03918.1 hypothetical protein SAMN02745691_01227 [Parasporobacterium paucivorans DSM 15970]
MLNPAKLIKLKHAWDVFSDNHPKFPKFIQAVGRKAVEEGTVIEINVTTTSGETLSSNLKLTKSDEDLFVELAELLKK